MKKSRKEEEYERTSSETNHRIRTKRTDHKRRRRRNNVAEYTSTWYWTHTQTNPHIHTYTRPRSALSSMCVRYAVEWMEITFIGESVANDCCHQYTHTRLRSGNDEKSLTHKWDGCSMRLDTPSLCIWFEWKFVDTHSASVAVTKLFPLMLHVSVKPPPLSVVNVPSRIHRIRAMTVMWIGLLCTRTWILFLAYILEKNRFNIQHSAHRTDGRSVCRSLVRRVYYCVDDIRIRISAAYSYACVCVTVETMRKGDSEKEKDIVAAHSGIWSSVWEQIWVRMSTWIVVVVAFVVSPFPYQTIELNAYMRRSTDRKRFFDIVYMKFIGCDWRSCCCCCYYLLYEWKTIHDSAVNVWVWVRSLRVHGRVTVLVLSHWRRRARVSHVL